MQRYGDRFDHNLHALRIVENFEQRYARFPGLNLTFEVARGMVKHSHDFGLASAELDRYLPGCALAGAQLIDLADEIAYNAADLDDAFSAGMFTANEIAERVPQYGAILEAVETQFPAQRARTVPRSAAPVDRRSGSGLVEGTAANAARAGWLTRSRSPSTRSRGDVHRGNRRRQPRSQAIPLRQVTQRPNWPRTAALVSMIAELFGFFVEDRAGCRPYTRLAETTRPTA